METWFIGPAIGAIFGATGLIRGREANRRLAAANQQLEETNRRLKRLEELLSSRTLERPESIDPDRLVELGSEIAALSKESLAEAVARLPEREKLAVVLYYYEGFKMREIAEVLGVSTSTVSRLLARAAKQLRAAVA